MPDVVGFRSEIGVIILSPLPWSMRTERIGLQTNGMDSGHC